MLSSLLEMDGRHTWDKFFNHNPSCLSYDTPMLVFSVKYVPKEFVQHFQWFRSLPIVVFPKQKIKILLLEQPHGSWANSWLMVMSHLKFTWICSIGLGKNYLPIILWKPEQVYKYIYVYITSHCSSFQIHFKTIWR